MNHFQTAESSPTNSLPSSGERWWLQYMGVPYVEFGRDTSGWDCWGLVKFIMDKHLGIQLPNLDRARAQRVTQESAAQFWHEVEVPQAFDVLCMYGPTKSGLLLLHVGLMVAENKVLHCERTCGTVCMRLNNPLIKNRIGKFIRHDSCLLSSPSV